MNDILVVNKTYDAEGPDSISVQVGDLVEVLDAGGKSTDESNGMWVQLFNFLMTSLRWTPQLRPLFEFSSFRENLRYPNF